MYKKTKMDRFLILIFIIFFPSRKIKGLTKNQNLKQAKDWNFLVYITSNNDLYSFSKTNIKQMKTIGSNRHINILVQQDTFAKKEVSRFFIEKNNAKLIEKQKNNPESISGTPTSLYKFVEWGVRNFPAKYLALIIWDHGTGIYDPSIWGKNEEKTIKGICFNEIFESYITNQELEETLKKIKINLLNGKKIDILGMDACYMAMIEIASQIKEHVKYMVSSQDAEPGPGWNYQKVLKPMQSKNLSIEEWAKHMSIAYEKEYKYIYSEYTQSTIKLTEISEIEKNISEVSNELISLLKGPNRIEIYQQIKQARINPELKTEFAHGNYVDIQHLYSSLLKTIKDNPETENVKNLIKKGLKIIEKQIIKSVSGPNLKMATGASIYFPQNFIYNSYLKTKFAETTTWKDFLRIYIKESKEQKVKEKKCMERPTQT